MARGPNPSARKARGGYSYCVNNGVIYRMNKAMNMPGPVYSRAVNTRNIQPEPAVRYSRPVNTHGPIFTEATGSYSRLVNILPADIHGVFMGASRIFTELYSRGVNMSGPHSRRTEDHIHASIFMPHEYRTIFTTIFNLSFAAMNMA